MSLVSNRSYEQSLALTIGSAEISEDMLYRYCLTREWDADRPVVNFIGLNPSTADALVDDPTIRRCVGFAKSWGFGKLVMTNLFALRRTDPAELCFAAVDPIGPQTNGWLETCAAEASLVVAAWGAVDGLFRNNDRFAQRRAAAVCNLILTSSIHALGFTKAGFPRHPLYMRGDAKPLPWVTR
jgi:hypothetical protein